MIVRKVKTKKAAGPFPGDILGDERSRMNETIEPIHVIKKPDHSYALCGAWVLYRPATPMNVELGLRRRDGSQVTLDEIDLEAGYIGNLPRHRESVKVGDLCRGCLEKVGKMRDAHDYPMLTKKAVAKVRTHEDREVRRAQREAAAAEAQCRRDERTRQREAKLRNAAEAKVMAKHERNIEWTDRMLEDE